MIPRFLRPEVIPFASVEFIPATEAALIARKTDTAPELEEVDVDEDEDPREELLGSECGAACGNCGRCS